MKCWCQRCKMAVGDETRTTCPSCGTALTRPPLSERVPRFAWPGRPPGMNRERPSRHREPL